MQRALFIMQGGNLKWNSPQVVSRAILLRSWWGVAPTKICGGRGKIKNVVGGGGGSAKKLNMWGGITIYYAGRGCLEDDN